jgi:hypothetical protein
MSGAGEMAHVYAFKSELTPNKVEWAYSKSVQARDKRLQWVADTGYKAALNRDQKLLIALEVMAETTYKLQEEQIGRLMRSPDATFAESRGTTEHQLCREAYRMVDQGTPIRHFEWIYGAAAILCGYVVVTAI